ncbi:MAG: hypothetical protein IT358_10480 [Gemmatimonadaceae bacterium]|nr:hypothetical protein [Gemmatimonadaceae bacterium]
MARSINNNGEIVGEGPLVPGGPMHALLWKVTTGSPPPPPPVGNTAPNATLVATTSTRIRAGGKVTMRGSFTDPDNGPWSYQFVWGNGTSSGTRTTAGSVTLSHKYAARGSYGVKFIVTDAKGAADTSSVVTVTVR